MLLHASQVQAILWVLDQQLPNEVLCVRTDRLVIRELKVDAHNAAVGVLVGVMVVMCVNVRLQKASML